MANEGPLGIPAISGAERVGSGGSGTVYRAFQERLGRTIAVKILREGFDDEYGQMRFEREARATGMLSGHPNIVTVFDAGTTESGQPYLLMAFEAGGSVGDRLAADGPLPWTEACDIGVKIAGALETAHQAGILHRDVKPENVLVSAFGEPLLADFGIARMRGGPETRSGTLSGSIAHLAPELLAGEAASAASDVYALGSTLFTMLTGAPAFVRDSDETFMPALARITSEPVPDLRARGVPGAVAEVIEQLMAKDPSERPSSAAEAGRLLQDAQRTLGATTTPLPLPGEAKRGATTVTGLEITAARNLLEQGPASGSGRRRRVRTAGVAVAAVLAVGALAAGAVALSDRDEADDPEAAAVDPAPDPTDDAAETDDAEIDDGGVRDEAEGTDQGGPSSGCTAYAEAGAPADGDGSEAHPHASVQALVDRLGPGETGCLRGEVFDEFVRLDAIGQAAAPVTLTAAPGERPLLRGGLQVPRSARSVVVRDLDLDGGTRVPAIVVFGEDIRFEGNTITGPGTCMYIGNIDQGEALNVVVRGNRIHHCGAEAEQVILFGISVDTAQTTTIMDNVIHDVVHRGVLLYPQARNTVVANNTIVRTGVAIDVGGDEERATVGTNISRNVIVDTPLGFAVKTTWEGDVGANNVVTDNCVADESSRIDGDIRAEHTTFADPQFVDAEAGDLRLREGSPCAGYGSRVEALLTAARPQS